MKVVPASELQNHVGEEVGVSDWLEVNLSLNRPT